MDQFQPLSETSLYACSALLRPGAEAKGGRQAFRATTAKKPSSYADRNRSFSVAASAHCLALAKAEISSAISGHPVRKFSLP